MVSPAQCELGSLASIREFSKQWLASGRSIDTLCLNAGAQFSGEKEPRRTEDGFELTVRYINLDMLVPVLSRVIRGYR
jgi:protochlorophyllide reductase